MGKVSVCDDHHLYQAGCGACRERAAARARDRSRQRAYGTLQPGLVPVAPALQHIAILTTAHAMSHRQIAEAAGIGHASVNLIVDGIQEVAQRRTIDAICSVTPTAPKDGRAVPALGATRRLQALTAVGYDTDYLAQMLTVRPNDVRRWRRMDKPRIAARHDRIIRNAYEHLSGKPGASDEARRFGRRMGYAPPHAWDDDTIDDPNCAPEYGNPEVEFVDEVRVRRVLNGHARIDTLHRAEQVELWHGWCRRRREGCLDGPGLVDFGRQYGVEARWVSALRKEAEQANTAAVNSDRGIDRKAA